MLLLAAKVGSQSPPGGGSVVNFSSLGLTNGDPFTVPTGLTVIMDVDSPNLGATDISGTVKDDGTGAARTLTTTQITGQNGGVLQIGTAAVPYAGTLFTISLTGSYVPASYTTINGYQTPSNPGFSRGMMLMPGFTLDLHGTPPSVLWTTLAANAAAAATSLTLATSPGWKSGDPVLIAPTDFPEWGGPDQLTLSGDTSGTAATLSSGLSAARYGLLQYPTDSGMSNSPGTFSTKKASVNVPTVMDQRARVVNMKRNIVVSCPNDTDWSTKGHGVHIMAMATNGTNQAVIRCEGVQIRRGGQRGMIGRYPLHTHVLSYNAGTGAFTADATASYFKKCVVWESENRAYTVHGTCGMEVSDCVSYKVKGHAFFLEDGSERRNNIINNLALHTSVPSVGAIGPSLTSLSGDGVTASATTATAHGMYSGQYVNVFSASIGGFNLYRIPVTVVDATHFTYPCSTSGTPTGASFWIGNDQIKTHDQEASGYWITNLDNTLTNNYASYEPHGSGMWVSLAAQCFGFTALASVIPDSIPDTTLGKVIAHSAYGFGLKFADCPFNEAGDIQGSRKYPQGINDGQFTSVDHELWKNNSGAYRNSTNIPIYRRWIVADNGETDFIGSTNNGGVSTDHLAIGTSLNNANPTPVNNLDDNFNIYPRCFFTSYHGTVRFTDCSIFDYPYHSVFYWTNSDKGRGGGGCGGEGGIDFYDCTGVDATNCLNTNLRLWNTHPGPMVCPIHLDGRNVDAPNAQRHYSVASTWYDADGKYGAAGNFLMPITLGTGLVDDYFLSGAASPTNGPVGLTTTCKSTSTQFFGMGWTDTGKGYIKYAGSPVNGAITNNQIGDCTPVTITRQDSGGTTIGTPFMIKRGDTSWGLNGYRTWSMQAGGLHAIRLKETNTCTISIASPCVVTFPGSAHGLTAGRRIRFVTTGALPTGISAGTDYFVLAAGLSSTAFEFSTTAGGSAVNTSGSQSGTQSYTWEADAPDSMVSFDVFIPTAAVTTGQNILLGMPFSGGATPRVCFGDSFSNEFDASFGRNSFASAGDVSAGRAIIASSGTSLANVIADTTGATFWQDTANNLVWVRFTNTKSGGGAALSGTGLLFFLTRYTVVVKV